MTVKTGRGGSRRNIPSARQNEDQNVCPTGMKNNTDTDTNSAYTKLVVPTKHIPGLQPGGPFQVPRSCCQDFPQLALTLSEV